MVILFMAIMNTGTLFAQNADPYKDEIFKKWGSTFLEGNIGSLIPELEENMGSDDPHPFVYQAWLTTQASIGDVEEAIRNADAAWKAKVEIIYEISTANTNEDAYKVYELVKEAGFSKLDEFEALGSVYDIEEIEPDFLNTELERYISTEDITFRTVWGLLDVLRNQEESRLYFLQQYEIGMFKDHPYLEKVIETIGNSRYKTTTDQIYLAKEYPDFQSDGLAQRFIAHKLVDNDHFEEAVEYYDNAFHLNPFYKLDMLSRIKVEVQLRNFEKARSLIQQAGELYAQKDPERFIAYQWPRALFDAGELGKTREVLEVSLQDYPNDPGINFLFGQLELQSENRSDYAIRYLLKATEIAPQNLEYSRYLLAALIASNEIDEVLDHYDLLLSYFGELNTNTYNVVSEFYERLGEPGYGLDVISEALEYYPASDWMWRRKAIFEQALGEYESSNRSLYQSFDYYNPYSWSLNQIKRNLENLGRSENDIEAEFEELTRNYPNIMDVWEVLASTKADKEEKIEVWQLAKEANPGVFHPYFQHKQLLDHDEDKLALYREYENEYLDTARAYDQQQFHNLYGQDLFFSDNPDYELAKVHLDKYLELYGDKSWYYNRLYSLYIRQNDREKTAEALRNETLYNPDNNGLFFDLAARYNDQIQNGSEIYYNFVQRNPYQYERWRLFIHYHAKWGGSAINAVRYYNIVQERFPDDADRSMADASQAYSSLGSNIKHFEDVYANAVSIGKSERYVEWYDISKQSAWESNTQVTFDWDTNTATILFEDGTVASRTDDPITSRILKLQVGDAYVQAVYDSVSTLLTLIENSAGDRVEIVYNDDEKIELIVFDDLKKLHFEYDSVFAKPALIVLEDEQQQDSLSIEYDVAGEISQVNALGSGGYGVSQKITSAFQKMQELTQVMQNGSRVISEGRLPDIGVEDEKLSELEEQLDLASTDQEIFQTSYDLANYLASNKHVDANYAEEAYYYLERLFYQANGDYYNFDKLDVVVLYYELLLTDKRLGVDSEKWSIWDEMKEWVTVRKVTTPSDDRIMDFYERIESNPIDLLPSASWLPKSILQNTGYWNHYTFEQLLAEEYLQGLTLNTILYRANGDIVVGTNKGLLVNQNGYWEHLGYNGLSRSFVNNVENNRLRATSNILSLAELDDTLYVGTADGLIILSGYKQRSLDRLSTTAGLPSSRVTHLESYKNNMIAGTPNGAVEINDSTFEISPLPGFEQSEITFIDHHDSDIWSENWLALGTTEAVYIFDGETYTQILEGYRSFGKISNNGVLYLLNRERVSKIDLNSEDKMELNLSGRLITTNARQVFGLDFIPVYEDELALTSFTDLGLSIFHEKHFEHFYINRESRPQVRGLSRNGLNFGIITDKGISTFQPASHTVYESRVEDLLSLDELGVTFFTDRSNPKYIFHEDPNSNIYNLGDYMSTTILAKDKESRLLVNDGASILRYTFDFETLQYTSEELFFAYSESPDFELSNQQYLVKNIEVDSSGVVWVATEISVFKYEETATDTSLKEFNYFKDSERFPCFTDMISKVHIDGSNNVFVVCSDEGHRSYNGRSMNGGLVVYNRDTDSFDLLESSGLTYNWFINSITPIGEGREILGTNGGFALKDSGTINQLTMMGGSESYQDLMNEHPTLFFGTKGASIGDVWLFGSAAGVVGFYDDIWFYPEQLNKMLPQDLEYANYGGRHINDLVTDVNGKVYIGTDLGLLIYDSGSSDPTQFLLENFDNDKSIEYFNSKIIEEERSRLISFTDLPEDNSAAKILKQFEENKSLIMNLENQKSTAVQRELKVSVEEETVNSDSLDREIEILNQRQNELLLTLEQSDPSIYQAIQIDPLDLKASRNRMEEGDVIIQYIPMPKKLFIQLIAKNRSGIFEVNISRDALMDSVKLVSRDLAYSAENLRVGSLISTQEHEPLTEARFENLLSHLYEMLLRPVELYLEDYENVYIAPVSAINYIPFGALIDRESERRYTYAIEKYNIGYISSLYLFQLINSDMGTDNNEAIFFGDPDGTLPGAREEVEEINTYYTDAKTYYGADATSGRLIEEATGKNIIHLATHGLLNDKSLKDSWLLFSDRRFKLSEIYNLQLSGTSMVVLSACQTSIGGEGLEYSTLARAFVNTGVPTILGTLWSVDDSASKELMVNFYENLNQGDNKFRALADAQRELLNSTQEALNHPSKWASYIVIGKP